MATKCAGCLCVRLLPIGRRAPAGSGVHRRRAHASAPRRREYKTLWRLTSIKTFKQVCFLLESIKKLLCNCTIRQHGVACVHRYTRSHATPRRAMPSRATQLHRPAPDLLHAYIILCAGLPFVPRVYGVIKVMNYGDHHGREGERRGAGGSTMRCKRDGNKM